jgi:hypothetical protein
VRGVWDSICSLRSSIRSRRWNNRKSCSRKAISTRRPTGWSPAAHPTPSPTPVVRNIAAFR